MKNVEDVYSLSPMQQGMLFHTLHDPDSGVYVEQMVCTLHGSLDVPTFQRAWQHVLERHHILRTAFVWEGLENPLQIVRQRVRLPWTVDDWQGLLPPEQEAQLEEFLAQDSKRGLTLGKAPLMRMALFRLTDDVHYFVWSHHHLLMDGWSLPLVLNEVFAFYEALARGQVLRLPSPRPYREYIGWLQRQSVAQAETFWRQLLAGFTTPTAFGVDKTSEPGGPAAYIDQELIIPEPTTTILHTLARQHGLTLNTMVQGVWALLLSRYSGEPDVLFGATVSGRPADLPGVETMVGLFINTLPVRIQITPEVSVLNWFTQLQTQQAELRQYEYSPLVQVQGWSEVPRGQPLFESLVVFENYPVSGGGGAPDEQPRLSIGRMHAKERSNYPLTIAAKPGRVLALRLTYDESRFDQDTILRMTGHLQALIERIAANPEQPLADLSLLTAAEQEQLARWNDTARAYPHMELVHELVAAQAARTPAAIALECGDTTLTYGALEARANQLAHHLRSLGVRPEVRVGLCVERSLELVIGLLGILKAGGAYVPLDPAYPQDRLAFMVQDSQIPVLVTQQALLASLPPHTAHVICLDTDAPTLAAQPTSVPVSGVQADHLAYLIYTSGTTGQPKAVQVEHHSLRNTLLASQERFGFQADDHMPWIASAAFDIALFELVNPLLAGGTTVILRHDEVLDLPQLMQTLTRCTRLHTVPSLMRQLVQAIDAAALPAPTYPHMRELFVGGDRVPADLLAAMQTAFPQAQVTVLYGPTEATIICTSFAVPREETVMGNPIGTPLPNLKVRLYDAHRQLVPIGVPGEVYLGGAGVTRGYLHQPELTAEKYVTIDTQRWYRTGDMARYRADGTLEFVGRIDGQVKVRGFRIELGEIEAVLRQHSDMQDAAVIVRQDTPGDQRLVAYVVAQAEARLDVAELRSFLHTKLPDYMVPAAFVDLEALPLTAHGKLDRKALPAPDALHPELDAAYVAPVSPEEHLLAQIWADVLGAKRVGVHDNFFTLGGHSLLATQLISRVREAFQVELPLRTLFEAATVAELAERIHQARHSTTGLVPPPLHPVSRATALPLSFAQQRLWFLDQLEPNSAAYNMPSALRLTGALDVDALAASLTTIVQRHESLRTTFATAHGQPIQVIHPAAPITLPLIDLQFVAETEREAAALRLATEEAQRPFDLQRGPLLRSSLLRLQPEEHVLLITLHHIVSDGWSSGVFLGELAALYAAARRDTPATLPELPVQYADYAVWQRQWLQGEVLDTHLNYWRQQLSDLPVLDLPTDYPRPAVQTFRGTVEPFLLPRPLADALLVLSRKEGATLFMTLLVGFTALLARYSGQDDIVIGTPIAGRTRGETERLIGCFINTLALRTRLTDRPSFRQALRQAREVALGAYAHQDLPFEQVVDVVQPERDLSRSPIFQVLFTLQNAPGAPLELAGLDTRPLLVEYASAKFDLSLSITETEVGLVGAMEYSTDLFAAGTIQRMTQHLERLLEGIVADPEQPLADLPLLTAAEHQQLLVTGIGPAQTYPQTDLIHELVAAQAGRAPQAIALECGDATLTYGALEARANQLAHHLRSLGVGPEVRVGLCVERSLELVIGLLGILKAGGAYVPLDPAYPQDRLAFMVQDSQTPVLVTQQALLASLPPHTAQVVCLDVDAPALAAYPTSVPMSGVQGDHLAYLIYTSGTTGRPKAVQVEHHSLRNTLLASQERFGFQADDRMPWIASAAFDIALFELVNPLLAGGTTVILRHDEVLDLPQLMQTLTRCTRLHAVPSLMRQLVQAIDAAALPAPTYPQMRDLFVGGDRVPADLLAAMQTAFPQARVTVLYGPTEATIICTSFAVPREETVTGNPIGTPLPNVKVRVYDAHRQLVPIGVPGEVYLGGAGVTRGYLHQPELTAEKYVTIDTQRWYRTGDMARYRADGTLEFVGRIDGQVKVRGFRIELGEIEAVLRQHPDMQDTAVIVRQDAPGEQRLVAYVVAQAEVSLDATELRAFLHTKLPDYMLPAAFVTLDALPLTAHGKFDRKALPAPDATSTGVANTYLAPRTSVEATLAQIWADVLRVERVGVHDNFFALGGDSILSIQIIARATQAGLRLTPKQLFQNQTIAELALVADTAPAIMAEQGLVTGSAPLTPIQHHFFTQDLPEPHHFNQSLLLEVRDRLDADHLAEACRQLVQHHDALRLRFTRSADGWQQHHADESHQGMFSALDLSALPVAERGPALERAVATAQSSLDLTDGPLVRVMLFDFGMDQPQRLLILTHHLLVDAVSWGVLLQDLQTAYEQISRGDAVTLPLKTTAFKQWAERLHAYAQTEALQQEQAYWLNPRRRQIASLPLDLPGGANTIVSAEEVVVGLSADETDALLHRVPPVYQTQINDVLLTALAQVLGAWTGEQAQLIDFEGHGREDLFDDVDLSRTVGWFTTLYPVLLDLDPTTDSGVALKAIKEQLRQIPQRGIGYGLLRYLSHNAALAAELQAIPDAQIGFNYLGQMDQSMPSGGFFGPARESTGPMQNPANPRGHILEITSMVAAGQLRVAWSYSTQVHRRSTIEALAQRYLTALKTLIAHCLTPEAGGYTPSDFPLAQLDQVTLDQVVGHQRQIADIYPLSPMQQGMLFHTLYEADSGVYVEQLSCTLHGALELPAFQRAWQYTIDRHPILRTGFVWEGLENPLQIVRQQAPLPWRIEDWRALTTDDQQSQLHAYLTEDRRDGFDLAQPPLMRMGLFQIAPDAHIFVWSQHHLLLDGWSLPLVLNEAFTSYDGMAKSRAVDLPASRPYRDYIAWLQQQDLAEAEAFWRQTLAGFTAPTPLGVDRPAGAAEAAGSVEEHFAIDEPTTAALQALVRQHGLTLNTVVQGAWAIVLSHYSGEADVVFGATVSGRPADLIGVEQMVGLFINTLPVRVHVTPDTPLLDWLTQLQGQQAELRQYEYSSLVQVQGWSEVPRGQPLFESLVVFENYPVDNNAGKGSDGDRPSLGVGNVQAAAQTNYPLNVMVAPGQELSVRIGYDRRRFETATIARLADHLRTLLVGMIDQPTEPIGELTLVSEAEQRRIRQEWNATATPYPHERCVHELVSLQVSQRPDTVALIYGEDSLTYTELNTRANQLAQHLKTLGVGPEVLVGICLERSINLVVGMLAILKAGGAYVPLDPSYPQERLSFMLQDTQTPVLLTEGRFQEILPPHTAQTVELDTVWPTLTQYPATDPWSGATADTLAYVMYTSGSTGRPKGTGIPHRAITRLICATDYVQLTPEDRVAQASNTAFDAATFEIWGTLVNGARLIGFDRETALNPESFAARLQQHQVTTAFMTTAWFNQVSSLLPEAFTPLRHLLFGGEACDPQRVRAVLADGAPERLLHVYGPTETTTFAAWQLVREVEPEATTVPIGKPIANTELYLLDARGRLVPVGVPGEVYIGGPGLARGYWNHSDLTAEKFVPDSVSGRPGARLYKTGDRARYQPDGAIEFLGRIDGQVKLRGFRIELGEIETVLRQHPSLRSCVVMSREDRPGDKRLVAYIVPEAADALPALQELNAFLQERLPDYMIPSAIVPLEALPLTPNGKVDRKALPAPFATRSAPAETYVFPRDAVEFQLSQIWEEILNVRPIGVMDDFFELGGHSLLALRIMTEIQKQFGQKLQLASLFEGPTISDLACLLRQQSEPKAWSPLVPLQPRGSRPPLFIIHPGGGTAFCYTTLAKLLGEDQPVYGIQARGLEEGQEPITSTQEMAAFYVDAIRSVQPHGPYLLAGWSFGGIVGFEMAQQLQRQGHETALLAMLDTGAPIRMPQGDTSLFDDDAAPLAALIRNENLPMSFDEFRQLSPDEQLRLTVELVRKHNILPADTSPEQVLRLVRVYKTNAKAMMSYVPDFYPGQLTLFKAEERPQIVEPTDEMVRLPLDDEGNPIDPNDPTMGWARLSPEVVEVVDVPGNHMNLVFEPHVHVLADRLRACLDQVHSANEAMTSMATSEII